MSAETARVLSEQTGQLWEDTAGRWGFSEQALSVKAFLLGVPIYFSRDVWFRHLYRRENPLKDAGRDYWRNVTRSMAMLLGHEVFDDRFRNHCEAHLGDEAVAAIMKELPDARPEWAREPGDAFTRLCGKNALPGQVQPELGWLDEVHRSAVDAARRTTGRQPRILVWRPGEHLVELRLVLPEAEIRCLDFDSIRTRTWQPWCRSHGVVLETTPHTRDYFERPLKWETKFDLVLIAGAVQDECRQVAERLLAAD